MVFDKIAWVSYDGGFYGTAHSHTGEPIGNVMMQKTGFDYGFVVQEFGGKWGVGKSESSLGLKGAKIKATADLQSLLEAA